MSTFNSPGSSKDIRIRKRYTPIKMSNLDYSVRVKPYTVSGKAKAFDERDVVEIPDSPPSSPVISRRKFSPRRVRANDALEELKEIIHRDQPLDYEDEQDIIVPETPSPVFGPFVPPTPPPSLSLPPMAQLLSPILPSQSIMSIPVNGDEEDDEQQEEEEEGEDSWESAFTVPTTPEALRAMRDSTFEMVTINLARTFTKIIEVKVMDYLDESARVDDFFDQVDELIYRMSNFTLLLDTLVLDAPEYATRALDWFTQGFTWNERFNGITRIMTRVAGRPIVYSVNGVAGVSVRSDANQYMAKDNLNLVRHRVIFKRMFESLHEGPEMQ